MWEQQPTICLEQACNVNGTQQGRNGTHGAWLNTPFRHPASSPYPEARSTELIGTPLLIAHH
ncbi:hypothetical protein [Dictyobacter aurantiacus]|uniref:hypothetical protein n=1 Tax=Dictyobacter aurantiacus TaxID=1936993 RepID=UPI000F819B9A|nr:hypothetical protein [Dictyobacter aurantiacus]